MPREISALWPAGKGGGTGCGMAAVVSGVGMREIWMPPLPAPMPFASAAVEGVFSQPLPIPVGEKYAGTKEKEKAVCSPL